MLFVEKIKKSFKYVNVIGSLLNFISRLKEYWESIEVFFYFIFLLFRFLKNLKNLKSLIRELGKEDLGNLINRIRDAYVFLCEK